MTLTFLGTRGEIEARTRRHRMHTSLLVSYRVAHVMIDCGLDWLGKFERLRPSAIVLTHAHPDHASGLRHGSPCPVHAPQKTWQTLQNCTIQDRHLIKERTPTKICGITFEAFPVEHSILAPAVGYRISAACRAQSSPIAARKLSMATNAKSQRSSAASPPSAVLKCGSPMME